MSIMSETGPRMRWEFLTAMALLALALAGCGRPQPQGIVAGTGHIAALVEKLGAQADAIETLIPPAMCPGHYDLKPADVEALSHAQVVLLHDWQMKMGNIQKVLEAAKTPQERMHVIAVEGNWLVPATQAAAAEAIAAVLAEAYPAQGEAFRKTARDYTNEVLNREADFKVAIAEAHFPGRQVLCNVMQAPFIEWAGLEVAVAFQGGTDLSAAELDVLIGEAAAADAVLVVDNLQSGSGRLSETLARELGTPRVVLSNFPGGFPDTPDWESTVARNVRMLAEAMEEYRD